MEKKYECPVCKNISLTEPPYRNQIGSDEICSVCGFQFGLDDYPNKEKGILEWRKIWLDSGSPVVRNMKPEERNEYYKLQETHTSL